MELTLGVLFDVLASTGCVISLKDPHTDLHIYILFNNNNNNNNNNSTNNNNNNNNSNNNNNNNNNNSEVLLGAIIRCALLSNFV